MLQMFAYRCCYYKTLHWIAYDRIGSTEQDQMGEGMAGEKDTEA